MTIAAAPSEITYVANGVTVAFAIPFPFDTSADITVIQTDTAGTPTTLTSGFSISGGSGASGICTFSVAPTNLYKITLLDDPTLTQPVDYISNDAFPAETHEKALDRATRLIKRLNQRVGRSIRVLDGDDSSGDDLLLPLESLRAGKFMGFDASGRPTMLAGTGADAALRTDLAAGATFLVKENAVDHVRTAAEISAAVTPANRFRDPYRDPGRYAVLGDAVTDDAAAIQRQMDSCLAAGAEVDLWGSTTATFKVLTPLVINNGLSFKGSGIGKCGLLTSGANSIFTAAAGVSQFKLRGFRLNSSVRYTSTPNVLKAIAINGTTASACQQAEISDLFIDGFETAIQANGVRECRFENIRSTFGRHGLIAQQQTVNNIMTRCHFVGESTGYAVQIGDGVAAAEGWTISKNLLFNFARGVWGFGSNNSSVFKNIIDVFTEYGVLLQSGAGIAATNWSILSNYMAASGPSASSAIRCLSSFASSDPRGNSLVDNDILVYAGSTLTNGILIDGTQEQGNFIAINRVAANAGGGFDLNMQTGANSSVFGNRWRGNGANIAAGLDPIYQVNRGTVAGNTGAVASAATITLPTGPDVVVISGTTNIGTINTAGHNGRTVRLLFQGALTVTDGSNLALAGNFVTTADDMLTLTCIGTTWFEASRSVN